MAYPLSTTTKDQLFEEIHRRTIKQLKDNLERFRATLVSASVPGSTVVDGVLPLVVRAKVQLAIAAARTDMTTYAQEQLDDGTFVWATELSALVTANQNIIDWIETNAPQTGGYLDFRSISSDGSGTVTDRLFAPAAFTGLVTEIDALLALIA